MKYKLTKQQIKEKYNSFSKWYDFAGVLNDLLIKKYRKELLKNAKGKVLEVGMGTGINLKYYPKDCEIVGIEISEEMLKRAKKRKKKLKRKATFFVGDAENLPFKNKTFETVVDTLGLCTYPNPVKALEEITRVCKPRGRILLLEHGLSNNKFVEKLQRKRECKHYQKIGCSLLRNHEILIKKAGLKAVKIERFFFGMFYSAVIDF